METQSILSGLIIGLVFGILFGYGITIMTMVDGANTTATEINTKITNLQETSMKCYWASEFQIDLEGTRDHFGGEDNTGYYITRCRELANENWNLMGGD